MSGSRLNTVAPVAGSAGGRTHDTIRLLRSKLGTLAEVRSPSDESPPILTPHVRGELAEWLGELQASADAIAMDVPSRTRALLTGPPGCGKTTLAHHLAARLGVPMVVVGPETLVSKFLGESGKQIAAFFDAIRESKTRCVILMDEVEALARKREDVRDVETNNTLTVMLRHIEQCDAITIAATNKPDLLDEAMWRRFHIHLSIDMPGDDERFAILKKYSAPLDLRDEDLDVLVALTDGASPSLLRQVMEAMKRKHVVWPRLPLKAPLLSHPVVVFESIIHAVRPPPGEEPPALWRPGTIAAEIGRLDWQDICAQARTIMGKAAA